MASLAGEGLIDPVEALSVLDGDVKFLPQLLERLVRRQVQSVEAVGR